MKKRVFSWLMILMMVMTIVPVYGEGEPGSDPAPTIVVTPVAESTPEPKNEVKDDPKTEVKDEPKTEADGEPKTEVKDEPKTEAEGEPKTEVKDEPKTEAEGEPKTEVKDEPKTEVEEEPKAQATDDPKTATAGEPEAEPKGDDTEEPQATPVEPEKPSIDYDKTVAENEHFDRGYVKLTGTAKVYERADAAEAYGEISRGVLYAIRRVNVGRSNERMEVAFATENGVKTAFVSAKAGKPMTDDAIDSFLKKMENVSAPHTYVDKSSRKFEVEILTLTVYAAEEEENASDAATPKATPVEPKPAAMPAEAAPDEVKPAATPAEATPVEVKPAATPAEAAPDEVKPAATPAEAAPDEVKPVATPAEAAPVEVKPAATPAEAAPIETKPEATPAEAANDQIDETRSEASDEDTRAAKIELSAARTEIGVGEKILLTAVVTDAEGTVLENATVTYASSNAKAAAVSTKGEVSAAAVGEATITASVGSVKASVAFTVKAAPESLTLVPDSVMLGEGDTFELSCTLSANSAGAIVEWVSSAETIASVENGVLTAKHAGTAVIRATLYNGVEGFCAVTVMAEPNDITLNPASMLLKEGETAELKATFTGDVYGKVEFYVPESNDVVELVAKDG
ncbi:MAG: Ig-like domain-containing protein, partial [Clostridiales bacterium]|nr:Ig-like domain-containing protein [Clostridiales bacterium]